MIRAYPVTAIRATAVVISTIIGVGVLSFPKIAAEAADSGAPLVTLAAVGIAFAGLVILAVLVRRYPKENIMQFGGRLIGKRVARCFNLLLILFFATSTGLSLREFGEVVIEVLLPETPIKFTIMVLLLITVISCRCTVIKFSYVHSFYLPSIVAISFVMFFASLKNYDTVNLMPIIGNHPDGFWKGAMSIAALFQSAFVLCLLIPYMRNPNKIVASTIWGVGISGIIFLLIVVSSISTFGAEETKHLKFPTLEAARSATIPDGALERLDGIFIIVWVISVFTTLFSTYYFSVAASKETFGLRDHRLISSFLLPYVFIVSLLPRDVFILTSTGVPIYRFGLLLTIGYPALLLLISTFRGHRRITDASNA
ncbi:GerAB/ArcD/ProY family transporter [Cohnella lupini]|uniref:Spore germination protein n=1 Tax=Cohnella lupini TaxID=1294267 RepID=A0A3D9IJE2_9BACL|nr:GerAB/ArcD/ProY family transporter [Cohnella lupini]RED61825.1 spore germination protein [Cohnella lupini]